jgi:hypothetical protein
VSRQRHVVRDSRGIAKAVIITTGEEPPEIEPWMAENVRNRGWSIEAVEDFQKNDIEVHGHANWKVVADELATALRPLLDESAEIDSEEQSEEFLANAQAALDAYDVTHMEVSMVRVTQDEEEPDATEDR